MSYCVFISYSAVDKKTATKLARALNEHNIDYYLDRKDMIWGGDVTRQVSAALRRCTHVLVVISPASLKSNWVPYEVGYAQALRKTILPFLMHPSIDLPGYLQRLHYKTELQQVVEYFKTDPLPFIPLTPDSPISPESFLEWDSVKEFIEAVRSGCSHSEAVERTKMLIQKGIPRDFIEDTLDRGFADWFVKSVLQEAIAGS